MVLMKTNEFFNEKSKSATIQKLLRWIDNFVKLCY